MMITVLHTAPHYVVCIKPRGVESEKQMPAYLAQQLGITGLFPVHRLDRDTAGVMVYALTKQGAAHLSAAIQTGTFTKTYFALVKGTPSPLTGEYTDLLFRDKQKNKSYIVKRLRKGVKEATLSYQTVGSCLFENQTHSLVRIVLQTGRTHQIRVQFAGRKAPLLGDKKYGGCSHPHLCLFAHSLTFPDMDGTLLTFTADPPAEEPCWQQVINKTKENHK